MRIDYQQCHICSKSQYALDQLHSFDRKAEEES